MSKINWLTALEVTSFIIMIYIYTGRDRLSPTQPICTSSLIAMQSRIKLVRVYYSSYPKLKTFNLIIQLQMSKSCKMKHTPPHDTPTSIPGVSQSPSCGLPLSFLIRSSPGTPIFQLALLTDGRETCTIPFDIWAHNAGSERTHPVIVGIVVYNAPCQAQCKCRFHLLVCMGESPPKHLLLSWA